MVEAGWARGVRGENDRASWRSCYATLRFAWPGVVGLPAERCAMRWVLVSRFGLSARPPENDGGGSAWRTRSAFLGSRRALGVGVGERVSSDALPIRQPARVLQPFAEAEGGLVALLRATLRTPHPQARELPLAVRPVDGSHGDWFCEPF